MGLLKKWRKQTDGAEGGLNAIDRLTRAGAVDLGRRSFLKKVPIGAAVLGLGIAATPSSARAADGGGAVVVQAHKECASHVVVVACDQKIPLTLGTALPV